MPISRKQFDLGIVDAEVESWARRIHIFLTENKEQAFTRGELREQFGLRQLRVRDHMPIARIEVPEPDLLKLTEPSARAHIVTRLKALDYTYITLDLAGFRSGSLNEILGDEVVAPRVRSAPRVLSECSAKCCAR